MDRGARSADRRTAAVVGIGTMIVFIATILVAAVAAAVIIDTSGRLQESSTRTGKEATDQISSGIRIDNMVGRRASQTTPGLQDLDLYVSLRSGSERVDLSQLRIQIGDGTFLKNFAWGSGNASAGKFTSTAIRDADGSHTAATPVMTQGDLVLLSVDIEAANITLEPRTSTTMLMLPEVGHKVVHAFQTPASYGTDTIVHLS